MPAAQDEPTIRDVATSAGVSKAQAARALGDYGAVSDTVRARVLAAAESLGYRANALARSITSGSTRTVGVAVADIANPFFANVVAGIDSVLRREGYHLFLADSAERLEEEVAAVNAMLSHRVDALAVAPASVLDTAHLREIVAASRPLVLFDRPVEGLPADQISLDHHSAAFSMTRHFLDLGHRRIAFVSSVAHPTSRYRRGDRVMTSSVGLRLDGFLDAMDTHGELNAPERLVRLNAGGGEAARQCIEDLLEMQDPPTAIVTSDSMIATVAVRGARALGKVIPDNVAIGSFDDSDWTTLTQPRITVVAQPAFELGVQVALALLRRLNGDGSPPRTVLLDGELVVRESSGGRVM